MTPESPWKPGSDAAEPVRRTRARWAEPSEEPAWGAVPADVVPARERPRLPTPRGERSGELPQVPRTGRAAREAWDADDTPETPRTGRAAREAWDADDTGPATRRTGRAAREAWGAEDEGPAADEPAAPDRSRAAERAPREERSSREGRPVTGPVPTAARPQVRKQRRSMLAKMQKFGRSLMLPIVTLPVAGLMLRLGQDDILGKDGAHLDAVAALLASGGNAVFKWLPLLFAVGVASGMAKRADSSTALAAVVGYMVFYEVLRAMSILRMSGVTADNVEKKGMSYGVLGGILVGLLTAWLWQKYHKQRLPSYLAFFGGRRLVPILTAFATSALAVVMGLVYQWWDTALTSLGEWTAANGVAGGFVFGAGNRLLLPVGLHHILNSTVWFQVGDCTAHGTQVHGDMTCFIGTQGATGGTFMTGFFPIMMFALPAAAVAIIHEARPENRKAVAGLMSSTALMAFLTGVTEPIEFAFMFVAWPLYLFHALMTGLSIALCNALGIRSGFSFSAGVMDLGLNWGISQKPLLLVGIGLVYAVIYYVVFRWAIRVFDLHTPGRELDLDFLSDEDEPRTRRERKVRDKAEAVAAKTASARSIRD